MNKDSEKILQQITNDIHISDSKDLTESIELLKDWCDQHNFDWGFMLTGINQAKGKNEKSPKMP